MNLWYYWIVKPNIDYKLEPININTTKFVPFEFKKENHARIVLVIGHASAFDVKVKKIITNSEFSSVKIQPTN